MDKSLRRSSLYIYLTSILQFQAFIGPILFVYYTSYMSLSTSQYFFCDFLLFIIMAVCEIPSGIIVDFIGRKKVLVISYFAICIGMLILIFLPSYTRAVIVAVIYGIFGAFQSGISESILYEIYEKANDLKKYEHIQARSRSVAFLVSIIFSILSGYFAKYNIVLPVVLDLIVTIFLLILSILLLEDKRTYDRKKSIDIPKRKGVFNVINIILLVAILLSSSRVCFSFYQPLIIRAKLPVVFLGYASAIYSIIAAISALFYKMIRSFLSVKNMYLVIVLLQIISTIGMARISTYLVLVFIFLQQIQRAIMGPFIYMQVNSYIN